MPPPPNPRILFVRNLPYKIAAEEMYTVFGRYGALRQVRVGTTTDTKGTAFIVYENAGDARAACEHLSGFNVGGRYLVVNYYHGTNAGGRASRPVDLEAEKLAVAELRAKVAAGEAGGDEDEELDDDSDRRRAAALRR